MRAFAIFGLLLCTSCSSDDTDREEKKATPAPISGLAAIFNDAVTGRIDGAKITVVERPDLSMTTAADGAFAFEVDSQSDVTLVLEHPDYPLIQTGTHTVPAMGIDDLTFQVPDKGIYNALAAIVQITPDLTRCQLVTTITRKGGTILAPGAHGEAGVTVSITPGLPKESGPIYFDANVLPDKTLTESTEDGGVLYVNVPVGKYVLHGEKDGATLTDVRFDCRAGVLVNASPPRGMNVE